MTKWKRFGTMGWRLRGIMGEILKSKKGKEVKVEEEKFIGFQGKEKWEGSQFQVESQPLIDPGAGQPRIIRTFMFKANPEFMVKNKGLKGINKQELFNNFWPMIEIELWKDGLVPDQEINPKITFKKSHFFIQITCKARMGVVVVDTPQTLQTILHKKRPSSP